MSLLDIPDKNELVKGKYKIPSGRGTVKVKITDLLSESLEIEVVDELLIMLEKRKGILKKRGLIA